MRSYTLNFTSFDLQLWPPPAKIDSTTFSDNAFNPSLFASLLLIYHAILLVIIQTSNIRDYQGRRDTVWYRLCLGHLLVIECFMIYVVIAYQKHCSLSDNISLTLYATCGIVVQSIIT